MKIVQVIDRYNPRVAYQEVCLSEKLVERGHEVTVVTGNQVFDSMGESPSPQGGKVNIRFLPASFSFLGRPWLCYLTPTLVDLDPDVIHCHNLINYTSLRVLYGVRRGDLKTRLVIDDHMYPAVSRRYLRCLYPLMRPALKFLVQSCPVEFVAVSPTTKSFMTRHYGLAPESIRIIPLGVDTEMFQFDQLERVRIRRKLKIPQDALTIISTGKFHLQKRIEDLIGAFTHLAGKHSHLFLLFVGAISETHLSKIQRHFGCSQAYSRIIWHGEVSSSALASYFSAGDVAVWPARHTISILEAMACGLPVLVSDDERAADELDEKYGFIFPKGDKTKLIESIRKLIEKPEIARSLGENARKAAVDHYDWQVIADHFLRVYSPRVAAQRNLDSLVEK